MNRLGRLVVQLGLDAAEFSTGLTKSEYEAQQRLGRIAKQAEAAVKVVAGLGIGAALVSSIRQTAEYEDSMGKLAARAGTTAEAISGLSYAARLSDVDSGTLARGLRELGNDAAEGGKKLRALGIDLNDASGKSKASEALFSEVADRLAGIESPSLRAAAAAKIFGDRIGPELLPLLEGGSKGIKSATEEAARFGRVVQDEAAAKAAEFNDNIARLRESAAGLAQRIGGPVIESLATASSYFIKVAKDVGVARAALVSFGGMAARTLGVDDIGQLESQARANQNAVALTVKQIEIFQRLADRGVAGAGDRVSQLRAQYTRLQQEGQKASQALKSIATANEVEYSMPRGADLERPDLSRLLGASEKKTERESEADRYLRSLENQLESTEKLTVVESVLRDIQAGRLGVVSRAQQDAILNTAAEIDAAREFAAIEQQFKNLQTERLTREKELAEAGARMYEATRTPAEKLAREIEEINRLLEQKKISWDTAARAQFDAQDRFEKQMRETKDQVREAKTFAEEFGLAFTSAFENAIVAGGEFSDILKGLEQDILRIIIRKSVTEPLGDFISSGVGSFFGSLFGGPRAAGGPVSGGKTYLVGERGPELFTPNVTGSITPNNALGMGGANVTVNVVNQGGGALQVTGQRQRVGADGGLNLDVLVEVIESRMADNVSNRSGALSRGLESGYGLRPAIA